MTETTAEYWNRYYGARDISGCPNIPSQFAAFVALEVGADSTIVDVGCGSGRDSLFFANAGFNVLGVDASSAAVSLCQRTAEERGINRASFLCCNVDDPELSRKNFGRYDRSDRRLCPLLPACYPRRGRIGLPQNGRQP